MYFKDWLIENSNLIGPVYHGGRWDANSTIKTNNRGSLGIGAYFTPDLNRAQKYAIEAGTNQIVEAHLQLNKPLVISTDNMSHPCVEALILLGLDPNKASNIVEKAEEQFGYVGKQISSRAIAQGYDGILQYRNNELAEIVIWNPRQVHSAKLLS